MITTTPTAIEILATLLLALAVVHTFSVRHFERLAETRPTHAGLWHLLAEVEVVFAFWATLFVAGLAVLGGGDAAVSYLDSRDFVEPMFVFAIMVVAGTRPILYLASQALRVASSALPGNSTMWLYFLVLGLAPLLGSLITEPAAMTLAALILRDRFYGRDLSQGLKYATLGVLFVNISIGGILTPYAAPPVLMVADRWGWDLSFMLSTFGARAAAAVLFNALAVTLLFRKELGRLPADETDSGARIPVALIAVHIGFLAGVVAFAHHPPMFMGLFLLFLGVTYAYARYQGRLILREGLLVASFLAGLVVLGGPQRWWLQPLLMGLNENVVFYGAAALTAITDNAALTYLGSLVEGLSDPFKQSLVAGAVTGGGLTIIANAPNPAGIAILRGHFQSNTVSPLGLFAAAIPPTIVAALALHIL